jgi:hypothetical protein
MKKIPEDLQWMLLAQTTSPRVAVTADNLTKKRKELYTGTADAIGVVDGAIHVLSSSRSLWTTMHDDKTVYHGMVSEDGIDLLYDELFETRNSYKSRLIGSAFLSLVGIGIPSLINNLRGATKRRALQTEYYKILAHQMNTIIYRELEEIAGPVTLHQGSIEEVENRVLNRSLEAVNTGKPEGFLKGLDDFFLRAHAGLIGADAVVNCQPGSSIGTPVSYNDK